MKTIIRVIAAFIISISASFSAIAGEKTAKVIEIDPDNAILKLSDGDIYEIPVDFFVDDLEPGMVVFIMYDEDGDKKILTDLQIQQ